MTDQPPKMDHKKKDRKHSCERSSVKEPKENAYSSSWAPTKKPGPSPPPAALPVPHRGSGGCEGIRLRPDGPWRCPGRRVSSGFFSLPVRERSGDLVEPRGGGERKVSIQHSTRGASQSYPPPSPCPPPGAGKAPFSSGGSKRLIQSQLVT